MTEELKTEQTDDEREKHVEIETEVAAEGAAPDRAHHHSDL